MTDNKRVSHIHGSMNSMYYVEPSKLNETRYIRMESQYYDDKKNLSLSYLD
jgi:hypothetical protein